MLHDSDVKVFVVCFYVCFNVCTPPHLFPSSNKHTRSHHASPSPYSLVPKINRAGCFLVQQYLELIERQEYQIALAFLKRYLKPMEGTAASTPNEFLNLCYLLTCKSVGDADHFRSWDGVLGREKLADELAMYVCMRQRARVRLLFVHVKQIRDTDWNPISDLYMVPYPQNICYC